MKGWFSASKDGDVEMIQDLLENVEIDINHRDDEGQTALYTACEEGKTEIVKMLLDSNADPNLCTKVIFWPFQRNLIKTLQNKANTPLITKITLKIFLNIFHQNYYTRKKSLFGDVIL